MNYCTVRECLKCEPQLWNSSRDLRRSLWQTNGCVYQVFSGLNFSSAIKDSVYMKMKAQGYTGGDRFLNRLKTYIDLHSILHSTCDVCC